MCCAATVLLMVALAAPATSAPSSPSPEVPVVTVIAYPPVVPDGGSVAVHWTGFVADPRTDVVSFACGPTNGLADIIDARTANSTVDQYNPVRFTNLVNMRCDYVFSLVRNTSNSLTLLGAVTVPVEGGPHAPIQGSLSFADTQDSMWVNWVSGRQPTPRSTPTVRFGVSPGVYTRTAVGAESTSYVASDLCNAPANQTSQILWRFPGFFHHVLLTGLAPGSRYYYVYGNPEDGWSDERSFVSRPAPGDRTAVRFLAYGDQDWDDPSPGSVTTAALALRDVMDGYDAFVLHFGDMSYGMGDVSDWDHWGREIEPYATRAPYMVSLGNHEMDYTSGGEKSPTGGGPAGFHPAGGDLGNDSNGECGVPLVHRFKAPSSSNAEGPSNLVAWYSFDYGPVHVVQFSSEHDWRRGSPQWRWLRADLAAVNRSETPWVVATAHRMLYSSQSDEGTTPALMREHLEPLLHSHKVNLFLVGHQHSYERFCPVFNGTCAPDGVSATTYIVAGTAGAGVDEREWLPSKLSLVRSKQWGYLRATATPHNLTVQFVANTLGEMYDEVVLQPWL